MDALTEAHRLAQARVGATTVARMVRAFPLLRTDGSSFDTWMTVVNAIVSTGRRESIDLAAGYLGAFRAANLTADPFPPVLAETLVPAEALRTSMAVTGPVTMRRLLASGANQQVARETALVRSSRAAQRHALNGGRETLQATLAADPESVGWRRVTSAKACEFCSMLAGRGAVYRAETATFQSHDGCSCSAEPVYRSR